MNKKLCLIVCQAVFTLIINGQPLRSDTIFWHSNTLLSWDNFKGQADSSSRFHAMSSISFEYNSNIEQDSLTLTITCCFNCNKSWVKQQSKNKILLLHEQTHFNIYEYYRRIFVQKLLATDFKKTTVFNQIKIMGFGIEMMLDKMNKEYDEQTEFSSNRSKQKNWTKDLYIKISQLQAYAQTELKLPLTD